MVVLGISGRERDAASALLIDGALVAATTVVDRDSITAHAIPHERLVEVMRAAGR